MQKIIFSLLTAIVVAGMTIASNRSFWVLRQGEYPGYKINISDKVQAVSLGLAEEPALAGSNVKRLGQETNT